MTFNYDDFLDLFAGVDLFKCGGKPKKKACGGKTVKRAGGGDVKQKKNSTTEKKVNTDDSGMTPELLTADRRWIEQNSTIGDSSQANQSVIKNGSDYIRTNGPMEKLREQFSGNTPSETLNNIIQHYKSRLNLFNK